MIKVGITGGIGSGKSTVARIFQSFGIPAYDADTRSKWLQENDPDIVENTKRLLGEAAYTKDQKLDRSYIAKLVFEDKQLLQKLNLIIHPAVFKDFEVWLSKQVHVPYVVKESALFCETGSYKDLDFLIVVTAPESTKIKRVLQRDIHRTSDDVKKIMAQQLPDLEKEKYAHWVVKNDDSDHILHTILQIDRTLRDKNPKHKT